MLDVVSVRPCGLVVVPHEDCSRAIFLWEVGRRRPPPLLGNLLLGAAPLLNRCEGRPQFVYVSDTTGFRGGVEARRSPIAAWCLPFANRARAFRMAVLTWAASRSAATAASAATLSSNAPP